MKNLIIASSSTIHNQAYLEYLLPVVSQHFKNTKKLLFIPYARPNGISHDKYTEKVKSFFIQIGIEVNGLHEFENPKKAIENAQAIFTGGGNTFLLVYQLYQNDLIDVLKKTLENGIPYLGTSAGSNITGITMQTTNDMPIIYPPSFKTLGLVPFNINPHYIDSDANSTHMGETRQTRIKEFHVFNNIPVLGLREGSWIEVKNDNITLKGMLSARWFIQNQQTIEIESGSKIV